MRGEYVRRNRVIERAVIALRLLQTDRYVTLQRLANELGTTERHARRYLESLEAARVPVRRYGPHYRIEAQ